MYGKYIRKEGEKEMKNAIYLDSDFVREEQDSVNALLRRFETLINSTDGVLTGEMIWRTILHMLNIDTKQDIIDAFGLFSLEDKIYDIKSVVLYKDAKTYGTYLLFNVRNANEENVDTSKAAEAFAKVYAKLNELQDKTGVKIEATITTDGINIRSCKDNLEYRVVIPKRALDEVVDITIIIENTIDAAISKMID
nr:MAG TPA: hypothetical protein [Caudoviricetes sp.]